MQKRNENSRVTYLQITTKCNGRCLMCDIWKQKDYEMDIFNIKNVLDTIKISSPRSEIRLTGGEPCLHRNFTQIVKEIKDRGLLISVITNGTLFDLYDPISLNIDRIFFSIDSPFVEAQKQIRGFSINLNQKYEIDLIANVIISELNKDVLPLIADWLNQNGVYKVNIIPMKDEKYATSIKEFLYYSKELLKACDSLGINHFVEGNAEGIEANRSINILTTYDSEKVCRIPDIVKFITINNKAFSCNSMPHRNLRIERSKPIKCIDCKVYRENKCDLSNIIYNELANVN